MKDAYQEITFSGSQATELTAFLPKLFKVKLSFLDFTSQTVTKPPLLPVTSIWGTFLFQSKQSKSSALAAVLPSRNGLFVLFRSDMNSYKRSSAHWWDKTANVADLSFSTRSCKKLMSKLVELQSLDRSAMLCRFRYLRVTRCA